MKRFLLVLTWLSVCALQAQNFNYLGTYDNKGKPDYLVVPGDTVEDSTLELIDGALSETFRVPAYNPHYITSNYDTDVFLTQQSEVFVTFVDEGAGFRNTLGFYTYDMNNPPSSAPNDEDVTIIFPNVSKRGSGGKLQTGDKVSIGTFPAGTAIGWVLFSNAWNGSSVGYGYWQLYSNPDFNPESNTSLRYHNVLIKDDDNELVILGFEDIRRDHSWCDHDFNDALFYVTATQYGSLRTTNNIDVKNSTDVYSSNTGGFESNGDLASLIAKRNFNRAKTNRHADRKSRQVQFNKSVLKNSNSLVNYFPESGMFGSEAPFVATPEDLPQYANADAVFSLDYYEGENRASAALLTETSDRIYDHSKTICDRLNGSKLKDVRNVTMKEHEMVFSIIERDNGFIEYAVHFSVKKNTSDYELYSFWNIGDYPEGDYLNFQVWGKTMGQVAHIVNHILEQLAQEKQLISTPVENRIPKVFISSGFYRNKQLHLDVINKSQASYADVTMNYTPTEQDEREQSVFQVPLSGEWKQTVVVDTEYLFDLGLSFTGENETKSDALYLADGPWGVDYNPDYTVVSDFKIFEQTEDLDTDSYQLERSVNVKGQVNGPCNIFRNILPGELLFDTNDYEGLRFNMATNKEVEVILVTHDLVDWSKRLRYTILANDTEKLYNIPFDQFLDDEGQPGTLGKLKSIVFSVKGEYTGYESFETSINQVAFKLKPEITGELTSNVINYPNPFTGVTTITVPEQTDSLTLKVYDLLGREIYNATLETLEDKRSITYSANGLAEGLYKYAVTNDQNKKYVGSFMVK